MAGSLITNPTVTTENYTAVTVIEDGRFTLFVYRDNNNYVLIARRGFNLNQTVRACSADEYDINDVDVDDEDYSDETMSTASTSAASLATLEATDTIPTRIHKKYPTIVQVFTSIKKVYQFIFTILQLSIHHEHDRTSITVGVRLNMVPRTHLPIYYENTEMIRFPALCRVQNTNKIIWANDEIEIIDAGIGDYLNVVNNHACIRDAKNTRRIIKQVISVLA